MTIWLIEDDPLMGILIREALKSAFPEVEIELIKTELGFQRKLSSIWDTANSVVILDVMLPWTTIEWDVAEGSTVEPPPKGYDETGGLYRAGIRCLGALRQDENGKEIPVIIYTVLTQGDVESDLRELPAHTQYLSKRESPAILIRRIKELTRKSP
ncbi:MAG: response regulator transcription factor [Bryobacterales bacterium]|nr:response regulator transcription factor [Bryobacterales bacterium]